MYLCGVFKCLEDIIIMIIKFQDVLKTYKSKESGTKALIKHKNWFPLKTTPALAGIAGSLIGDGHVQGPPKLRIDYTSKSKEELRIFSEEIYSVFKVKGKIRKNKTNKFGITYNLGINCSPLARIIILLGIPYGPKVLNDFSIPKWIKCDKCCFSTFVSRLFDCEGCVDIGSRCIEIKMYKSLEHLLNGIKFFNDIRNALDKHFGIKTTKVFLEGNINVRKDRIKTRGIRIKIKKRDSLKKFKEYVGFGDKIKQQKFNLIVG